MATEQIRGDADQCDVRTDLYALGSTFFHLVTGKYPFPGKTSAAVMKARSQLFNQDEKSNGRGLLNR